MAVAEHTIELASGPVFFRQAPPAAAAVLYLHSAPTSSDDWVGFLEHSGGLAPDLLGYGRSSKAGHLEYTLPAYADFVEAFLAATQVDRVAVVGHGWGAAIALVFAQRHPERVTRLVIIDALPLLAGFAWPKLVNRLRRAGVGELAMGAVNRRLLARGLRAGSVHPEAWSDERIDALWEQFDQGTQRAILRLHRSIDPAGLAAAGAGLDRLEVPTLIVWGEQDTWLAPGFADAYQRRLPDAVLRRVPEAGHWPWLDRPEVIGAVCDFARPDA